MRASKLMIAAVTAGCLSACADDASLMNVGARSDTPDEFSILPTKALQMPPDLAQLPAPTPGGANITDPTPLADAAVALGANPGALTAQGVPASDGALLAYTARAGRDIAIRSRLAREDADFRSSHGPRPLERLARTNVYLRVYQGMLLNGQAELARWRRAGVRVPAAPPGDD